MRKKNITPEYFYDKKNLCVILRSGRSVQVSQEVFDFMRREEWRRQKSTKAYYKRMMPLDRDGKPFEVPVWDTVEDVLIAKEREQELTEKVRKLLNNTKPLNRTIVEQCIMGDSLQRAFAKELGISEKALSKRLIRTVNRMRKTLEAERVYDADDFYGY